MLQVSVLSAHLSWLPYSTYLYLDFHFFHDKAKRTQQRNLLFWCTFLSTSKWAISCFRGVRTLARMVCALYTSIRRCQKWSKQVPQIFIGNKEVEKISESDKMCKWIAAAQLSASRLVTSLCYERLRWRWEILHMFFTSRPRPLYLMLRAIGVEVVLL